MQELITKFQQKYLKPTLPQVRSGDTVRVHQKIREGGKERVQMFEGLVIRTRNMGSLPASITVRRVASGVGVEKIFKLHSPNVVKVDVVRHSQVRRNYLTYIRERAGKAARLKERQATELERAGKEAYLKSQEVPAEPEVPASPEAVSAEPAAPVDKKPEPAETQTDEMPATEKKAEAKEKPATDKAQAKKEKAEAFRKAQEAKK